MLVVLALVFGAIAGVAAHYALPHRTLRGVAVGPLLGAVLGTATWTAMTWAGVGPENGGIWAASIAVPALLTTLALRILSGRRETRDAKIRRELGVA